MKIDAEYMLSLQSIYKLRALIHTQYTVLFWTSRFGTGLSKVDGPKSLTQKGRLKYTTVSRTG